MDGLLLPLIVSVICGAIAAAIASSKNRSAVGWFFGGFFLGIVGIVIVAVIRNLKEEQEYKDHVENENRRLKEQLMQEKMKNESFRSHTYARLDAHDRQLGVNTRNNDLLQNKPEPKRIERPTNRYYNKEDN